MRDLVRIEVTVSSRVRWGLNWYLGVVGEKGQRNFCRGLEETSWIVEREGGWSDRANIMASGERAIHELDSAQVIGNVKSIIIHRPKPRKGYVFVGALFIEDDARRKNERDSQLEESEVGVTVICPVLALLCHVVLKYGCGLWVVSIETIQDSVNVRWPVRRVIECYTHGFCEIGPSGMFGERSHWWLIEKCGIHLAEDSPMTFLDFSNISSNAGSNIYFVVVSVIQL